MLNADLRFRCNQRAECVITVITLARINSTVRDEYVELSNAVGATMPSLSPHTIPMRGWFRQLELLESRQFPCFFHCDNASFTVHVVVF